MQRIGAGERRARLAVRHRLAPGSATPDPVEATRSLVAVHGSDPSSVYLGLLARMTGDDREDIGRALYDDRSLIRLLAMRRTVFVTTRDAAPILQAACSQTVADRERRKFLAMLDQAEVGADPEAWLADVEQAALAALTARGEATAAEVTGDDPRLQVQLVLARGKKYEGRQGVGSRVLFLLAAQGHIVRGRPRGSWTSSQYRWAPMSAWLPDGLPGWETARAEVELARRWLAAYGPATVDDLRWWTGWTKTQVRRALTELDPAEVDLDGVPGIVLADDRQPTPEPDPWVALLPALDSTPMGWQQRDWFLGAHAERVFDRTGNVGPTVWCDGRVVGGWGQDPEGRVVCRLEEDVGSDAVAAANARAQRLTAILKDVRLTPRARTLTAVEQDVGLP